MIPRPLLPDDVEAAAAVARAAIPMPAPFEDAGRPAWVRRRVADMAASDPAGAWVTEHDGAIAGVALATVRDGLWGLSLLAVDPAVQARGIGRALLDAALAHGADAVRGGLIASSTDPKAMRLYAQAGFSLRPCVSFGGIVDRAALPAGLAAGPSDDLEAAAALSRPVRGGAYAVSDLALYLEAGAGHGLLIPGRGFAIHRDGSPFVLCARDDEAAADLLWSCLAAAPPGATVHVDLVTAGQDWAIRTGLAAGLALSPDGPFFTRGELGPLRPFLPSGAFL